MLTKTIIENYFNAEKQESIVFLAIGIVALAIASIAFFYYKTPFAKGLAIPLWCIGVLMLSVGYTVYKRSDADRINNVYRYDMNPQELKTKELPRMQKVMQDFIWYRYTEIALMAIGIFLFFYFKNKETQQLYYGIGLGLMLMASAALIADYFAETRGKMYIKALLEYTAKF